MMLLHATAAPKFAATWREEPEFEVGPVWILRARVAHGATR